MEILRQKESVYELNVAALRAEIVEKDGEIVKVGIKFGEYQETISQL